MNISLTDEDIAIRANVLARFAHRVWNDPQYLPSNSARSPLMALDASYKTEFLECGHLPSKHSDFTTGYGTDIEGKRSCYDCCAKQERAAMIKGVACAVLDTTTRTLALTSNEVAAANCRAILAQLSTDGKVDHKAFIGEMQSRSMEHYGKPLDKSQLRLLARIAAAYEAEQQS